MAVEAVVGPDRPCAIVPSHRDRPQEHSGEQAAGNRCRCSLQSSPNDVDYFHASPSGTGGTKFEPWGENLIISLRPARPPSPVRGSALTRTSRRMRADANRSRSEKVIYDPAGLFGTGGIRRKFVFGLRFGCPEPPAPTWSTATPAPVTATTPTVSSARDARFLPDQAGTRVPAVPAAGIG